MKLVIKMHYWYMLIVITTLLMTDMQVVAQENVMRTTQVEQSKELSFINPRQRRLKLPFKSINNLIILPIQINESDTLHFILDTGINTSIISELSTSEKLELNYAREIQLQGLGTGTPLQAMHSFGNEINISGVRGINQDFFVLLENIFKLSEKLGSRIDGILSYSVFSSFITRIDYEKEIITLYNPEYFKYKKAGKTVSIPLIINNNKPHIYIKLQVSDTSSITVKVMLDTGASSSLWLDEGSLEDIDIPPGARKTFLGSGLSGDVTGYLARFDSVSVGRFNLKNVLVSLPDSVITEKISGSDNRNGSIGAEILRRFNIIIDYPNEIITLSRNDNYNEPFSYNRCGIELTCPLPGINFFQISHIYENSPAEKAGLHVNDFIHSINGTEADELTLNEIYKIFQGKPGNNLRITADRSGQRIKFSFKLADYILAE